MWWHRFTFSKSGDFHLRWYPMCWKQKKISNTPIATFGARRCYDLSQKFINQISSLRFAEFSFCHHFSVWWCFQLSSHVCMVYFRRNDNNLLISLWLLWECVNLKRKHWKSACVFFFFTYAKYAIELKLLPKMIYTENAWVQWRL